MPILTLMRTRSIHVNSPTLVRCHFRDACLSSQGRVSLLPEKHTDFCLVLIKVRRRATTKIISSFDFFFFLHTTILPQVLSDMPYTDRWTSCPSSYDRLMWLVQRNPRVSVNNRGPQLLPLLSSVMFISLFATPRPLQKREKARE